jgi:diguanylate cyclase (GGDEF)-like protein
MGRLRTVVLAQCGLWMLLSSCAMASAGTSFRVFRLGDRDMPAAEVISGQHDAQAVALPTPVITPTSRIGGWWRVEAVSDLPRDPPQALVLDAPNNTMSEAWLPGQDKPLTRSTVGPDADPTWGPHVAVFELPEGLHTGQHIYLHVMSTARSPETLRIADVRTLREEDRRDLLINTLIHGTLLALVLVGIGMGLTLRESDFLLLGCGLAFALLFLLDNTADLYRIPGLAPLAGVRTVQRILGSGAAFFTGLFMLRYLQMQQRAPWLARIQRWMLWVYVFVVVVSFVPVIGLWQWPLLGNIAVLVSVIVGLVTAVKGALAGDRPSQLFLWSWLPLLVLLSWRVLEINLGWPANDMLQYAFPASFVLAGVLLMVGLGDRMLRYKRERDASDLLAHRDPLTEVYNRRALDERLHAAALQAGQSSQPLALLFVDLDHFKRINDEHGHDVGDECLREVVRRIRGTLRFGDVLGRYGGEEFVIGLPGMHVEDASAMGERIRLAVGSQPVVCGDIAVGITISIGVAELHDGLAGFDAAIKRADRALYASKRGGRDRVSASAT